MSAINHFPEAHLLHSATEGPSHKTQIGLHPVHVLVEESGKDPSTQAVPGVTQTPGVTPNYIKVFTLQAVHEETRPEQVKQFPVQISHVYAP